MKIQPISIVAVLAVASLGRAAPPASAPSQPGSQKLSLLVAYKAGNKAAVKQAILAAGGTISYSHDSVDTFAVTLPQNAVDTLADRGDVAYVEEDAERHIMAGDLIPWGVEAVQARRIWDADLDGKLDPGAPKGNGKKVCIIDTGILRDHPDLAGVEIDGESLVPDAPWDQDNFGHGTFIAGIIAAQQNGTGTLGIAPKVSIYSVRASNDSGQLSTSTVLQAAERCEAAGVDVINMSFGGPFASRSEDRFWNRLLNKKNILLVAAAGNDGNNAHQYPASYDAVISVAATDRDGNHADFSQVTPEVELAAPGLEIFAAFPRQETWQVTVDGGAVYTGFEIGGKFLRGQASGRLEWGGDCREPGNFAGAIAICNFGDFWGTDFVINNMMASGAAGLILLNRDGSGYFNDLPYGIVTLPMQRGAGKDLVHAALTRGATVNTTRVDAAGYRIWQGTSFSTPHVVGVAALIWSKYPKKSAAAVRAALDATAKDLGPAGRDPYFGFGLVQAKAAMDYLGSH